MKKNKSPEIIELSTESLEGVKSRLTSGCLLDEDKAVLLAIVSAYVWIHGQLITAKLNIFRLKKMFGFSTEKRNNRSEKRKGTDLELDLNAFGNQNNQQGSSDSLQATTQELPTKK